MKTKKKILDAGKALTWSKEHKHKGLPREGYTYYTPNINGKFQTLENRGGEYILISYKT